MDPFRLCLALGPVAVYLVILGSVNLSRRPFLVSGVRDAAALGIALAGFVIVGPMLMFFPDALAAHIDPKYVKLLWGLMVALYGLGLVLVLLTMRPRLVIYNISSDQLRPILAEVVGRLDPDARWAGDSLMLPALGVQLHLDSLPWMRNVSLVSAGPNQGEQGWRRLEAALSPALAQVDVPRNPRGVTLWSIGVFITGALIWSVARDPQAVTHALFEMLQIH